MTCKRCETGRMFTDLEGDTSCVQCGYRGPVYAADSPEARALVDVARLYPRTQPRRLQGAAAKSHERKAAA